ncbi:hypothetical protein VKT23_007377 [Stygiomarasmius scandens]|uniref:Crinkler (CRN) family protein n=1 Tax=Marasmiellus scandens TaxID=2682957 RepID=A0ABR1JQ56_9AGAR
MSLASQAPIHPLLQVVNYESATDPFAHTLYQEAFLKKNRKAFFSPVTNVDGSPVLDAQDIAYERLQAPLGVEGYLPESILVLADYRTAFKDIAGWFTYDRVSVIRTLVSPDDYDWARWVDFSDPPQVDQSIKSSAATLSLVDNVRPRNRSVQVVGIPGIGKSLFLIYTLVERLLLGLETCLQTRANYFTLWCSEGAFDIFLDDKFEKIIAPMTSRNLLPKGTWYLLDSNKTVSIPCSAIQDSFVRIVQASSPQMKRLEWVMKQSNVRNYRYLMKPPSLNEMKLMKTCQDKDMGLIPDEAISDFFNKYGPSARMLFIHVECPLAYEQTLRGRMERMGEVAFDVLLKQTKNFVPDPAGVSHLILGVYPGSHRQALVVNILTAHIYQLVKDVYGNIWSQKVREMYQLLHRNLETRATTGYIFEDQLYEVLRHGVLWEARELKRSKCDPKNVPYNHDFSGASRWLYVGQNGTLTDQRFPGTPTQPDFHYYDADNFTESGLSGYFRPHLLNRAAYDSYMVNMDEKKVVVFQFTVAKKHDAKESGLDWLEKRYSGFEVHYVIFTSLPEITVYMPIAFDSFLKTKSQVVVSEAQLFSRNQV